MAKIIKSVEEFLETDRKKLGTFSREVAVTLITPIQSISVVPEEDSMDYHSELIDSALARLIGVGEGLDEKNRDYHKLLFAEISKVMPEAEKNYVVIKYSFARYTIGINIELPRFVTKFQIEELEKLGCIIEKYTNDISVTINNFNPATGVYIKEGNIYFDKRKCYSPIEDSIKYMKKNRLVVDYDLDFGEIPFDDGTIKSF